MTRSNNTGFVCKTLGAAFVTEFKYCYNTATLYKLCLILSIETCVSFGGGDKGLIIWTQRRDIGEQIERKVEVNECWVVVSGSDDFTTSINLSVTGWTHDEHIP